LEVCELKAIDRAEFLSFLQAFNEVGHNSAETLAVEYESAVLSARRLALAGSAASKLASTLLEWGRLRSHDAGKPIQFRMPLTHEELGNMAGLSRETVTRLLGKFRKEGLLDQDGPQMTLREPGRMKQLYC
jgi:CRP/FNR family transcriptional regulator